MIISLKTLLVSLSDAASNANDALARDYDASLREQRANGGLIALPEPLRIAEMKVTFSAHVSDSARMGYQNDENLRLEFGKNKSNFKGEVVFSPYEINAEIADNNAQETDNTYSHSESEEAYPNLYNEEE